MYKPGIYRLRVWCDRGYEPYEQSVKVEPGKNAFTVMLVPFKMADLYIDPVRSWGEVKFDDNAIKEHVKNKSTETGKFNIVYDRNLSQFVLEYKAHMSDGYIYGELKLVDSKKYHVNDMIK